MINFNIDFLEPRTGLEPVTLLALPTELTRHICGNTYTHYDSGNTSHCCLSDFRENKVSRIYLPKAHTKLPLCVERLVSYIHYILAVHPTPFNQLLLCKKHLRPPSAPTRDGRLDMTYQFRLRGTKICTRGK